LATGKSNLTGLCSTWPSYKINVVVEKQVTITAMDSQQGMKYIKQYLNTNTDTNTNTDRYKYK